MPLQERQSLQEMVMELFDQLRGRENRYYGAPPEPTRALPASISSMDTMDPLTRTLNQDMQEKEEAGELLMNLGAVPFPARPVRQGAKLLQRLIQKRFSKQLANEAASTLGPFTKEALDALSPSARAELLSSASDDQLRFAESSYEKALKDARQRLADSMSGKADEDLLTITSEQLDAITPKRKSWEDLVGIALENTQRNPVTPLPKGVQDQANHMATMQLAALQQELAGEARAAARAAQHKAKLQHANETFNEVRMLMEGAEEREAIIKEFLEQLNQPTAPPKGLPDLLKDSFNEFFIPRKPGPQK